MNYIIIQKEKEIFKLNIKDIYYIQTHPSKAHTVQIFTKEASFDLFQNLSKLDSYLEHLKKRPTEPKERINDG